MLGFGPFLLIFGPHCLELGFLVERTDGWMERRADFPCVLQDFVPFGAAALLPFNSNHTLLKQGTGTAYHLLPLGCYLLSNPATNKSHSNQSIFNHILANIRPWCSSLDFVSALSALTLILACAKIILETFLKLTQRMNIKETSGWRHLKGKSSFLAMNIKKCILTVRLAIQWFTNRKKQWSDC